MNPADLGLPAELAAPAEDPHRKTRRFPLREAVRFRRPFDAEGTTVDIGAGGVGVEVSLPLKPGAHVELEMFAGHAIVLGTVRWATPSAGGFRVGIQFTEEDWGVISRIQHLRGLQA